VTRTQRDHAKHLAYGLLYGMGPMALASALGVQPKEAMQLSDEFKRTLPGVEAWKKRWAGGGWTSCGGPGSNGKAAYALHLANPNLPKRRASQRMIPCTHPPTCTRLIADCCTSQYVATLAGRRRWLPNINSSNRQVSCD
jgi:hypothetical protein